MKFTKIFLMVALISMFLTTTVSAASPSNWYVQNEARLYPENVTLGPKTLVSVQFVDAKGALHQYVVAGKVPTLESLGGKGAGSLKVSVYDLTSNVSSFKLADQIVVDLNNSYAHSGFKSRVYDVIGLQGYKWPGK